MIKTNKNNDLQEEAAVCLHHINKWHITENNNKEDRKKDNIEL